ncbi:putative bifunctional diguanylate cyclase/phosphodiesterase [Roseateles sp. P5_E7]
MPSVAAAPADKNAMQAPNRPDYAPLLEAKVMMVDDEALMTDLIQTYLEDEGYANFVATNDPREALALLRREEPGLVLLDLMMPQMSGFEVLEAIRADPELRYTPVIVLTASTGADAKLRALQLGATDFLAKPVDASELVLRVRNTLAYHQYHVQRINFDALTGLPHQRQFDRHTDSLLQQREAVGGSVALFSIEIPEYKQLRETVDQSTADRLAQVLAHRLERFANDHSPPPHNGKPAAARVGRLGADHFGVLLEGQPSAAAIEVLAKRLVTLLAEPVELGAHDIVATPWIGIAVSPEDGTSAEAMRKGAELASTHARAQALTHIQFASLELNAVSYERLKLGSQLRGAIQRGELLLHYQPKVSFTTGGIVAAEALVRWQHPELGLLQPGNFIALAEEMGLISALGEWVIKQACRDAACWTEAGFGSLKLALNVAKPQFISGDLCGVLRRAMADTGIAAHRIVIELTESMLMDNVMNGISLMNEMKSLGVTLSIDDFGTGYSSLSYLKRFPLDELKIDRSFVMDLPGQAADLAIARTVVDLGHSLGMTVTAEGVETQEQHDCLAGLGCDMYQGFIFSKPVRTDELLKLLRTQLAGRE